MNANAKKRSKPTFVPALDAWPDAGVYQLWIELRRALQAEIGALGVMHFDRGTYVYTGRASRNLLSRVMRHVHGAQRLHWHIDYLLFERETRIEKVVLASTNPDDECLVNRSLADGGVAVPGFGASDCRNGCRSHLWKMETGHTSSMKDHHRPQQDSQQDAVK